MTILCLSIIRILFNIVIYVLQKDLSNLWMKNSGGVYLYHGVIDNAAF